MRIIRIASFQNCMSVLNRGVLEKENVMNETFHLQVNEKNKTKLTLVVTLQKSILCYQLVM